MRFDLLSLWQFVRGEFFDESLGVVYKKQEELELVALGQPALEVKHFVDEVADKKNFEMYGYYRIVEELERGRLEQEQIYTQLFRSMD